MDFAVIFDLDGTLVETAKEGIHLLVGDTLRALKVEPIEQDMDIFWFEADRDRVIEEKFCLDPKVFWPVFMAHYDSEFIRMYKRPYPDVEPVLAYLKKAGFRTGIVTGAAESTTTHTLRKIYHRFDNIVIANPYHGVLPKPNPDGLHKCLASLKASSAFYIGNGAEDILAGYSAGFKTVLIDRGEYPYAGILPHASIATLHDLPMVLESLKNPR